MPANNKCTWQYGTYHFNKKLGIQYSCILSGNLVLHRKPVQCRPVWLYHYTMIHTTWNEINEWTMSAMERAAGSIESRYDTSCWTILMKFARFVEPREMLTSHMMEITWWICRTGIALHDGGGLTRKIPPPPLLPNIHTHTPRTYTLLSLLQED